MDSSTLQKTFDQVKEKLLMDFSNFYLEQSYQQAFSMFDNATINTSFEVKTLRQILERYDFDDFVRDHSKWLKNGK